MELHRFKKKELQTLLLYYGQDVPYKMKKDEMIEKLEVLLRKPNTYQEEMDLGEVQMSVRVRRIKESNKGE